MTGPRTYGDPCGVARALDAIGERWALLVVRELAFGPKRFTDLRAALNASPNVLSQRLGDLVEAGVVERSETGGGLYELTDWGRELHPILVQLSRWGAASVHRPSGDLSVDALMLAMEAAFKPDRARGLSATYEVRLGDERFSVAVHDSAIDITRARPKRPNAIIETDPETFSAALFGDRKLVTLPIEFRGDIRLGRALFGLFACPK